MLDTQTDQAIAAIRPKHDLIPEINGLRGLAILGVVFHHLLSVPISQLDATLLGPHFDFLYRSGWLGVNLFFMLSGFVLYLPYALGQRRFSNAADWRWFYKHRALRLLPAYYLITLAETALIGRPPFDTTAHGLETVGILTLTLPFMPGLFSPPTNWALWSIGTEFLFSAVFPLVCLGCARFGTTRILVVCIPFSLAVRFFAHSGAPNYAVAWLSDGLLLGRLDEFLWGMLLAAAFAKQSLPKRPYALFVAAMVLLLPSLIGFNLTGKHEIPIFWANLLFMSFDAGMATLIAAAVCGPSLISKVLRIKPLIVIGMACYSIYLWHYPILVQLRLHIDPWNGPTLFTYFIYLSILSAFTYRYVEFRKEGNWRVLFGLDHPSQTGRF